MSSDSKKGLIEKMSDGALAGVGILITRPQEQNEALAALIEKNGGHAYQVPAYEIGPAQDQQALDAIGRVLETFDLVVFVSATAVAWGCKCLKLTAGSVAAHAKLAAVGASTAAAMKAVGLPVHLVPTGGFDSENLLALPELENVANKKVLIVRGEGGRELLANTLRSRGADVKYAEVYQRRCPDKALAEQLTRKQRDDIDIAVVTSNEGLQNLHTMAGRQLQDWVRRLPLVVMSRRAVDLARDLGFEHVPRVVELPGNEGIIEALVEWKNDN